MLTPIDTHILVGILTKIAEDDNAEIELGSMVMDSVIQKERDVDITIRYPDDTRAIYKALEVKKHSRKLDVSKVEQLCAKFSDMPSIKKRGIVSASGYTKEAIKKAIAYGVELYEIVQGDEKKGFGNIIFWDQQMPVQQFNPTWSKPPNVTFTFDENRPSISPDEYLKLPLYLSNGTIYCESVADYLGGLSRDILSAYTKSEILPTFSKKLTHQLQVSIPIPEPYIYITINDINYRIADCLFEGTILNEPQLLKSQFKALTQHNKAEPIGTVFLFEPTQGNLLGFLYDKKRGQHRMIHIPKEERESKSVKRTKVL